MLSRSFKTDSDASTFFACHFQFRQPFPNTDMRFDMAFSAKNNPFMGAKDRALWCGDNQGLCGGMAGIFEGSLSRSSIKMSVQTPATRA